MTLNRPEARNGCTRHIADETAMAYELRCGSRKSPPAAATRPRLTSGIPNRELSAATSMPQAGTISRPPACA
ncbi:MULTISPECIES: hypothetical protein [unclassified Streptomyces]|uniref:hypothetical protein n=1 Tax=unclassified Streptomyces TaxID=2593676 RepID=UPI0029C9B51E|nr:MULTISPECIES: hypothetical protein [unclassified Streptomyces]